jgi:hypothetical protein
MSARETGKDQDMITKMTDQERYRTYQTSDTEWRVWDHETAEWVATFDNYSDARDLEMELRG